MNFWLEFFKDKRFSWDFKIANFIMRDSLRNYLATACLVLNNVVDTNSCTEFQRKKIIKVVGDLNALMNGG